MRRTFALTLTLFLPLSGLALWSCFAPTYSDCAFRCASSDPPCPAEYECHSDGYCHLPQSPMICALPGSIDLSSPSMPDLAQPTDADSTDGS